MNKSDLVSILSDLTNINLVILGLSVSLFTVIYSFLINKRNDFINLSTEVASNAASPFDKQKLSFIKNYIGQFSRLNRQLAYIMCGSLFVFIITFITNRFLLTEEIACKHSNIILYSFCLFSALVVGRFVYIFVRLFTQYNKEIKI
jgi:hypothetical protein